MPKKLTLAASAAVLLLAAAPALADGDLHIYNWGDYTNPKLIEKFEKAYNVKVTLDDYDSNETMLSKVRTGNTGYECLPAEFSVCTYLSRHACYFRCKPAELIHHRVDGIF